MHVSGEVCVSVCGESYVYRCRATCVWCLMACAENVMCVCRSVVRLCVCVYECDEAYDVCVCGEVCVYVCRETCVCGGVRWHLFMWRGMCVRVCVGA